jgi:hypothetical protein
MYQTINKSINNKANKTKLKCQKACSAVNAKINKQNLNNVRNFGIILVCSVQVLWFRVIDQRKMREEFVFFP